MKYSEGTYEYNPHEQTLKLTDQCGIRDEFGAFQTKISGDTMTWKRLEEGMAVEVTLFRSSNLPMATADLLVGLWKERDGDNLIQIRWDRIYVKLSPDENRKTGYWHIHAHRPEITFLPHTSGLAPSSFKVNVDEQQLMLTGTAESKKNDTLHFQRIFAFPGD